VDSAEMMRVISFLKQWYGEKGLKFLNTNFCAKIFVRCGDIAKSICIRVYGRAGVTGKGGVTAYIMAFEPH